MKREIKFRRYYQNDETGLIATSLWGKLDYKDNDCFDFSSFKSPSQLYRHYPIDDCQFTGLKDKNGVDIYEGDILKIETDKPMIVGWSKKFASFVLNREGWAFSHWFGESCNPEDCEVIGNIYQNPELFQ